GGSIHGRVIAGHQNLAVLFRLHREHAAINQGDVWSERSIERTVGIEAGDEITSDTADVCEISADNNLSVRLKRKAHDRLVRSRARIKRGVQRAVGVEPRNAHAAGSIEARE